MWSQCVPSEEVCISLRVYAASRAPPSHPTSSRSFSPHVVAGDYSPAKMQHLCIARGDIPFLQNESIGRPLYDERRNFPAGTDDIFRENIGNFIPTSKNKFVHPSPPTPSVSGGETDFISFQQGRTDFQSFLTANRFIASFFFAWPLLYSKIGGLGRIGRGNIENFARTFIPRNWSLALPFTNRCTHQIET